MSDSNGILERYASRTAENAARDEEEAEVTDDFTAFGWLRGIRDRAVSLELRKKTGDIVAIGYSYIETMHFDASGSIAIKALGKTFQIKGRNLNAEIKPSIKLYEGLCRHKVPWIKETDQAADMRADDGATVIEQIDCE